MGFNKNNDKKNKNERSTQDKGGVNHNNDNTKETGVTNVADKGLGKPSMNTPIVDEGTSSSGINYDDTGKTLFKYVSYYICRTILDDKRREEIWAPIIGQIKVKIDKDLNGIDFSDAFKTEDIKIIIEKVIQDIFSSKDFIVSFAQFVGNAFAGILQSEKVSDKINESIDKVITTDKVKIDDVVHKAFQDIISKNDAFNSKNINKNTIEGIIESVIRSNLSGICLDDISKESAKKITDNIVTKVLNELNEKGIDSKIFSEEFFKKALIEAFSNTIELTDIFNADKFNADSVKKSLEAVLDEKIDLPENINDTIVDKTSALITEKLLCIDGEEIKVITAEDIKKKVEKIVDEKFKSFDKNDELLKNAKETISSIISEELRTKLSSLEKLNALAVSKEKIENVIKESIGSSFENYSLNPVEYSNGIIKGIIEPVVSKAIENVKIINANEISKETITSIITNTFNGILNPIKNLDVKNHTTILIEKAIKEELEPIRKQIGGSVNLLINEENRKISKDLTEEKEKLEKKKEELNIKLQNVSDKQDSLIKKLNEIDNLRTSIETKLETLSVKELEISDKYNDIDTKNLDITNKYNDIKEKNELIENAEATIKTENERIKGEWNKIKDEKESIRHEKESIDNDKQTINSEKENIDKEKKSIEVDKALISSEKQSIENEKEHIKEEKESIRLQRESISGIIDSYKNLLIARITYIGNKIDILHEKSKSLYSESSKLYEFITKVKEYFGRFKKSVDETLSEDCANYSLSTYSSLKDSTGLYGWTSYIIRISTYSRLASFKFSSNTITSLIKELEVLTISLYTEHGIELIVPSLSAEVISEDLYNRKTDATLWSREFCETTNAIKDIFEIGYKSYLNENDKKKPVIYY